MLFRRSAKIEHHHLTHLYRLHRTHYNYGLGYSSAQTADQASGAVQLPRLVPHLVTEELKHTEPEDKRDRMHKGRFALNNPISVFYIQKSQDKLQYEIKVGHFLSSAVQVSASESP